MDYNEAAESLLDMRRTGRIEPNLPEQFRPIDLPAAYSIQARVVEGLLPEGAQPIGYKCACTSEIAQQALRIDRPVFGRLLSHTTSSTGAELPAARFTHRVIEAEFGFQISQDVQERAGGHTAESIAPYVHAVIPAIEIVDYRYADWTIGGLSIAADNAIHGWWIEGIPQSNWHDMDLGATEVVVSANGEVVTAGSGANVLDHPLNALPWLANDAYTYRFCSLPSNWSSST